MARKPKRYRHKSSRESSSSDSQKSSRDTSVSTNSRNRPNQLVKKNARRNRILTKDSSSTASSNRSKDSHRKSLKILKKNRKKVSNPSNNKKNIPQKNPLKKGNSNTISNTKKYKKLYKMIRNNFKDVDTTTLKSLYDFRCSKKEASVYSYGGIKGNYFIPLDILEKIIDNDDICKSYALTEKKTDFYTLMIDFDMKDDKLYYEFVKGKELDITKFVVEQVNNVISKYIDHPNLSYVYCDKNIGFGVHLYYPEILVNNSIHIFLLLKLQETCIANDTFKLNVDTWKHICDISIAKANGLRLPYFYKDGNYYKPHEQLSTYKYPNEKGKIIRICSIRSDKNIINFKLKNTNMEEIDAIYQETENNTNKNGEENKGTVQNKIVPIKDDDKHAKKTSEDRMKEIREVNKNISKEEVENMLEELTKYGHRDDRNQWQTVTGTLKGANLFDIWDKWSSGSDKYNKKENIKEYWNKVQTYTDLNYLKVLLQKERNKLKTDTLDKHIFESEKGHSNIVYNFFKDIVRVTEKNGNGYIFDDADKIWKYTYGNDIASIIPDILEEKILLEIDKVNKLVKILDDKEYTVKIKVLNGILQRARTYKHAENVWKLTVRKLRDNNFLDELNSISNLLPIKNNLVINMRNCKTRERTKEDKFTFSCDVNFIENMGTPNADKFFSMLMKEDKECVEYLQRCLGYIITGETTERCLFICSGNGANGKSVLCLLLDRIFNKFCVYTGRDVLIKGNDKNSSGRATPSLVSLLGKRIGIMSETDNGEELNASQVKKLTGFDKITARQLYGTEFTFKSVCKFLLLTNNRPEFDATDQAMIDRLRYIPFDARFTVNPKKNEYKKDDDFIEKLMTEYLDEVFTWLCLGAMSWYNNKQLIVPAKIQKETNKYVYELNILQQFIDEACEIGEDYNYPRANIWKCFVEWSKTSGKFMKKKDFSGSIVKSFKVDRINGGTYHIFGLKIKDELVDQLDKDRDKTKDDIMDKDEKNIPTMYTEFNKKHNLCLFEEDQLVIPNPLNDRNEKVIPITLDNQSEKDNHVMLKEESTQIMYDDLLV